MRRVSAAALGLVLLFGGPPGGSFPRAAAQEDLKHRAEGGEQPAPHPQGQEAFERGNKLLEEQKWVEALAAFQESAAIFDHAIVQYNIGVCELNMRRYVAARRTFGRVLANPVDLEEATVKDVERLIPELNTLIVRVTVLLQPPSATLVVDGRPLLAEVPDELPPSTGEDAATGQLPLFAADPSAADRPAVSLGLEKFTILLDPGVHIFRASRPGHDPASKTETYREGRREGLDLRLDLLRAKLTVESIPPGAIIKVAGHDVGPAPKEVERLAGTYKVEARLHGYKRFKDTVSLAPGQERTLTASLRRKLVTRWWFWTSIAAALAVAGGVTWAMWPEPPPPPYDGGSTGWIVTAR